jgi:hypothetical protein
MVRSTRNIFLVGAFLSNAFLSQSQICSFSSDSNIQVGPTQRANQYTLLESTNLTENSWSPVETKRGTESNLVFTINRDAPTKFFKTDSSHEPVEPTSHEVTYTHYPHQQNPTSRPIGVYNFATNNVNVMVDYIGNPEYQPDGNPYNFTYTTNMPFEQSLTPGENSINTVVNWSGSGTGGSLFLIVNLEVTE